MNTTFGLVPGGRSPGTYRLAEVMSAGAIPVFVARDIIEPFREQYDWPSFSFAFAPTDVLPSLVETLRAVSPEQLAEMQVRRRTGGGERGQGDARLFFLFFCLLFERGYNKGQRKGWEEMESRKGGGKEGGTERQSKGERDEGTGGGRERGGGGGGSNSIGSRFVLDCDDQCVVFLSGDVKSGVSGAAGRYEVPKVAGCQLLGLEVGEPRQENARKVVVCTRSANTQQSGRPASGLRYSGGTRTSFQPFYTRLSPLARCTSIGTS